MLFSLSSNVIIMLQMDESASKLLMEYRLEHYKDGFADLGVANERDFLDVTEDDAKQFGMKTLEMRRFVSMKEKLRNIPSGSEQQQNQSTQSSKISVPLPSQAFAQSHISVTEEELKAKYQAYFYLSPQNLRQNYINSFILKMCSANSWLFGREKDREKWIREERELRWNTYLSIAHKEEVGGETAYYKKQNIDYRMHQTLKEYSDINIDAMKISQIERIHELKEKTEKLSKWADDAMETVQTKYDKVVTDDSKKEQKEFWQKLKTRSREMNEHVHDVLSKISVNLENLEEQSTAKTYKSKADSRNKAKNIVKGQKRKLEGRSEKIVKKRGRKEDPTKLTTVEKGLAMSMKKSSGSGHIEKYFMKIRKQPQWRTQNYKIDRWWWNSQHICRNLYCDLSN